ncbi:hypothetical protein [Variovorax gossypii]
MQAAPRRVCGFIARASSFGCSTGEREPGRFHASGCPVDQPVELPPRLVSGRQFLKTAITCKSFLAISARAPAHVLSLPESSETAGAESLALQASDDIDNLQVVRRAYTCLEKLIAPHHVNDTEEVYPTRTEFSALVWLVNEELGRRIEAADITIQSLRIALNGRASIGI